MANWKEKGVVPDSDDEDGLDSQSTKASEGLNDEPVSEEALGLDDIARATERGDGDGGLNGVGIISPESAVEDPGANFLLTVLPLSELDESLEDALESHIEDDLGLQTSPLTSPATAIDPWAHTDSGGGSTILPWEIASNSRSESLVPVEDEISRSYVQITSPTSTRLSSPPSSGPTLPPHTTLSSRRSPSQSPSPQPRVSDDALPTLINNILEPVHEPTCTAKRSLRQRNLIQLHPYIVEQEKYRNALKARGVAPMRLESSQEDSRRRNRNSASPVSESQEQETLDMNVDRSESQLVDFDWDPPSSSPVRSTQTPQEDEVMDDVPAIDNDNEEQDADEDEEFPAISKLLQGAPQKIYKKHEPKKRFLKTYSTKFRRPPMSRIQTQTVEPNRRHDSAISIFDVPASPPATSSPFTIHSRNGQNLLDCAGSRSKEPTPSITMDEDDDPFLQPVDLPTPATSAIKQISLSLDSDLENTDPFAHVSGKIHFTSSSSSSDESKKIRKISRKIRGVLPASHLRLDHKIRAKPTNHVHRATESASPVKDAARRGVALPRTRRKSHSPPPSTSARLAFLSDSEGDDEDDTTGFIMGDDNDELEGIFDQSPFEFAQEDDRIDAMLPSKKRTLTGSNKPQKKRKDGSGSGLRTGSGSYNRQPRITDHVNKPRGHISLNKTIRRSQSYAGNSILESSSLSRPRNPAPPNLSILDVVDTTDRGGNNLPHFIRVAARTARSKAGKGRQSPSKKFIRLANREDTQDAQSVLQKWKQGMIAPSFSWPQPKRSSGVPRNALQEVTGNLQSNFPPYPRKNGTHQLDRATVGLKRKLIVSRHQRSINDFVRKDVPVLAENNRSRQGVLPKHSSNSRSRHHPVRPAQLESPALPYSDRYHTEFKSRKNILDIFYRNTRRRPIQQPNLQLSRFLADDDIRPSVENVLDIDIADTEDNGIDKVNVVQVACLSTRRRKQAPRRVDAGAANYRQPTDPLILDFFSPVDGPNAADDKSKLAGLGKFGTNYPLHFDIYPLLPGIFFHESTLIGSRRLSEALYGRSSSFGAIFASPPTLKFAEKCFAWQTWEESVSSEVGVCFDWLLDQFLVPQTSSKPAADATEVIMFVLDYVQHNVSFDGPLDRDDFMARMAEVMQDFSTRLNAKQNFHPSHDRQAIEVLSICCLVVLSLLNSTRTQSVRNPLTYDFEDLLKSLAGHCVDLLLSHGLGVIRKLYDDLQYLSFREGGIKSDQYAANAWVILIKVLEAAQIPRGSFWDITNIRLVDKPLKDSSIDAPAMERIWYSLHTLLPLCEFDEFGVIVSGLRQKAKFDNWPLPQQILKKVFALYKSNQRQSPGFNDYCRALFNRCYHLMTEWGWWKCPSIAGTLFDFFASHSLAHLRNEEVYASPRFLEQLDTEPSLAVEAEDRCFHIFLKIVALGIRHLAKADDVKSIRNLVARLLPNHDRQYPKDETIHQRDLAALRNHHDLLCTLFWVSPASQRPPVSLIQELVVAERSHNEACLINIRAWENLTRFIVTKSVAIEYYKPFTIWQSAFFSGLCQQYLDAEKEVRQQAEALEHSNGQIMSEARITGTVLANRRNLIIPMCTSLAAMGHTIKSARSSSMAKEALNCDVLARALSPDIHINGALSNRMIRECVVSLCSYMDQIKNFHPRASQDAAATGDEEGDSQDSLYMTWNWERMEMVIPLRHNVLDKLCPLVRKYLEKGIDVTHDNKTLLTSLVTCWARIVSVVSEEGAIPLEAFLVRGRYAVFENRLSHQVANSLWPLFLVTLLKNGKTMSDFRIHGFVIASEWLIGLANCQSISEHERALTVEMQKNGHFLCKTIDTELDHIPMMRGKINSILKDNVSDLEVGLSQKKAQNVFADILGNLMDSIQHFLESLVPGSDLHEYHLQVARVIIADIRSYAEFVKIPDFFLKSSSHFWPYYGDPAMFGAGLISYCLKLAQQSDQVAQQLFHYLFNGWKSAIVSNRMGSYNSCIRRGMKWWEFTKFMLSELVPALLVTGFKSSGWLICSTFLPAVTKRVIRLLENTDSKSTWVFENLLNILKMVMNGTVMLLRQFNYGLNGVNPSHRGILSVTFKFWFAIALPMRQYAIRHSQEEALEEVTDPLSSFSYSALHTFHTDEHNIQHPYGQFDVHKGKCTDGFSSNVIQYIKESWDFQDQEGFKVVVRGRTQECSAVHVGEMLERVLEMNIERYECAYPNKEGVSLPMKRNIFVRDLYI
ncbi:hypothetical protein B2J93_3132 [Marssonina coronariae]|uniref:Mus7/MMS22 family protein n=1 Tax=Diplocarpon coronariae TaxID=2795749 RepID=A0A218Z3R5_9HELO|nr:hypothetical protein B2J93_3132 [Marssonina coronariae]